MGPDVIESYAKKGLIFDMNELNFFSRIGLEYFLKHVRNANDMKVVAFENGFGMEVYVNEILVKMALIRRESERIGKRLKMYARTLEKKDEK